VRGPERGRGQASAGRSQPPRFGAAARCSQGSGPGLQSAVGSAQGSGASLVSSAGAGDMGGLGAGRRSRGVRALRRGSGAAGRQVARRSRKRGPSSKVAAGAAEQAHSRADLEPGGPSPPVAVPVASGPAERESVRGGRRNTAAGPGPAVRFQKQSLGPPGAHEALQGWGSPGAGSRVAGLPSGALAAGTRQEAGAEPERPGQPGRLPGAPPRGHRGPSPTPAGAARPSERGV
jgi:hypothetical protein